MATSLLRKPSSLLFQRCWSVSLHSKKLLSHGTKQRFMASATTTTTSTGNTIPANFDPSKLIPGITLEQFIKDPDTESYIRFNFPEEFTVVKEEQPQQAVEDVEEEKKAAAGAADETNVDKTFGQLRKELQTFPMNIRKLYAYKRCMETEAGTNAGIRLRDDGYIPGILYGSDPSKKIVSTDKEQSEIMIKIPANVVQSELDRYHRDFESRVYDVTVYENEEDQEGTVHRVLPRGVQRHPISEKWVYCVNLLRYHPGRPIQLPWIMINEEESQVLKRDTGFLIPVKKYIECIVDEGVAIPEALELECTGLEIKDIVRLDRIIFPEGVRISKNIDPKKFIIGPIHGSSRGIAEDDDDKEGNEAVKEAK